MVVCFELLPQQISHSIKKYIDMRQHAISTNRSCWRPKLADEISILSFNTHYFLSLFAAFFVA